MLVKSTLFILTACVFLLNATLVMSHHGRSNFLFDISTTLEGKIINFKWRNPHTYMEIQTINDNNETETWLIEGGTPTALIRQGWKKDSIKAGDSVTVVGNPDRDQGKKFLLLAHIIREDGEALYVNNSQRIIGRDKELVGKSTASEVDKSATEPTVVPSRDFSGLWRRGLKNFVASGYYRPPTNWPLTELGEAQVARFDRLNNPSFDCLERGIPFFPLKNYDFLWIRYEDRIEIIQQQYASTRTLYLNQDRHPEDLEPNLNGHSIAHFDDNGSLLVDTVGFPAGVRWGLAPGLESSEQKHVREHYILNEDGLGVNFTVTIEDPVYLTEPMIINGSYFKVADIPFEPYVCDLEAARINLTPSLKTPY